jgi:hypothetical protein
MVAVEPKSEAEAPTTDLIRGAVSSQFTFAHTVSPRSFFHRMSLSTLTARKPFSESTAT